MVRLAVSNLIERVTVTVTLNHDEVDSAVYHGATDLKEIVKRIWPHICPWVSVSDGSLKMAGIEIQWRSTGLEEVPEIGNGDN